MAATATRQPLPPSQGPVETQRISFGSKYSAVVKVRTPITGNELFFREDIEQVIQKVIGDIKQVVGVEGRNPATEDTDDDDAKDEGKGKTWYKQTVEGAEARFYLRVGIVAALVRFFRGLRGVHRATRPAQSVSDLKFSSVRVRSVVPLPSKEFGHWTARLGDFRSSLVEVFRSVSRRYRTPASVGTALVRHLGDSSLQALVSGLLLEDPEDFSELDVPVKISFNNRDGRDPGANGHFIVDRHWVEPEDRDHSRYTKFINPVRPLQWFQGSQTYQTNNNNSISTSGARRSSSSFSDPLGLTNSSLARLFSGSESLVVGRRRRPRYDSIKYAGGNRDVNERHGHLDERELEAEEEAELDFEDRENKREEEERKEKHRRLLLESNTDQKRSGDQVHYKTIVVEYAGKEYQLQVDPGDQEDVLWSWFESEVEGDWEDSNPLLLVTKTGLAWEAVEDDTSWAKYLEKWFEEDGSDTTIHLTAVKGKGPRPRVLPTERKYPEQFSKIIIAAQAGREHRLVVDPGDDAELLWTWLSDNGVEYHFGTTLVETETGLPWYAPNSDETWESFMKDSSISMIHVTVPLIESNAGPSSSSMSQLASLRSPQAPGSN